MNIKRLSDVHKVGDVCFDAVALTFDLEDHLGHFVPVAGVLDSGGDIDFVVSHYFLNFFIIPFTPLIAPFNQLPTV